MSLKSIWVRRSALLLSMTTFLALIAGCDLFGPAEPSSATGEGTGSYTYPTGSGALHGGILEDEGLAGTASQFHQWTIILHSDSLAYSTDAAGLAGTGDMVAFGVISNSMTGLDVGTYTHDSTSPSSQTTAMVFDVGTLFEDYDAALETHSVRLDATGGTFTVEVAGPDYVFSFDLATGSGNVTGTYSGSLLLIDD